MNVISPGAIGTPGLRGLSQKDGDGVSEIYRDSVPLGRVGQPDGIEPTRTSHQSLWQNGWPNGSWGTVRRELLNHAIVLDEEDLRRLLGEYVAYYHDDRTPLGVENACAGGSSRGAARCGVDGTTR